jgi:hypothetical protein
MMIAYVLASALRRLIWAAACCSAIDDVTGVIVRCPTLSEDVPLQQYPRLRAPAGVGVEESHGVGDRVRAGQHDHHHGDDPAARV